MNKVEICGIHYICLHININFEKFRVCATASQKIKWSKIPLTAKHLLYFVFLQAKFAGSAVLQMLFLTPDISFLIGLGLLN